MTHGNVREAVAVFEDTQALQGAIDELLESGFDRASLSLLADEKTVESKLGHAYEKVEELEDDPNVPTTSYVSIETVGDAEGGLIGVPLYVAAGIAAGAAAASGGSLVVTALAALVAGGAGATVGAVLAGMLGEHHAEYLSEQLKHGGLLLWVNTPNAAHEDRAKQILEKHSAHDVHVHSI